MTTRDSPTERNYNATEVFLRGKRNTLQSRLFEFPFRASRYDNIKYFSVVFMLGTASREMRISVCSRVFQALL